MSEYTDRIEIVLKRDWDAGVSAPTTAEAATTGHFAGRVEELRALAVELQTKTSGSILVAGHRGVGKTSLVFRAISAAIENGSRLLPVVICAPHLEIESIESAGNGTGPTRLYRQEAVVKNLIRRLYMATKQHQDLNKDLRRQAEELYKQAVAREFAASESTARGEGASTFSETETASVLQLDSERLLRSLASFGVAILVWFTGGTPGLPTWLAHVLHAASVLPLIAGAFTVARRKVTSDVRTRLESTERSAEVMYSFDNSIGNLVHGLESLHASLAKDRLTPVYVIDEVDKVDTIEALKGFKGLFTLSQALFIFITDEAAYDDLTGTGKKHPELSTYFTSRYYLSKPGWDDLHAYMVDVFQNAADLHGDALQQVERSFAYRAANDFFGLKGVIRNHITGVKSRHPIVETTMSPEIVSRATMHSIVTHVYENYARQPQPTEWRRNETELRGIFDEAEKIRQSKPGFRITGDPLRDPPGASRCLHFALWRIGAAELQPLRHDPNRQPHDQSHELVYTGNLLAPTDVSLRLTSDEEALRKGISHLYTAACAVLNLKQKLHGGTPFDPSTLEASLDRLVSLMPSTGLNWQDCLGRYAREFKILSSAPPGRLDAVLVTHALTWLGQNTTTIKEHLPRAVAQTVSQTVPNCSALQLDASQPFMAKLDEVTKKTLIDNRTWLASAGSRLAILTNLSRGGDLAAVEAVANAASDNAVFVLDYTHEDPPVRSAIHMSVADPDAYLTALPRLGADVRAFLMSDRG